MWEMGKGGGRVGYLKPRLMMSRRRMNAGVMVSEW